MKISDKDIYNFISCSEDLQSLGSQLIKLVKKGDLNNSDLKRLAKLVGDVLYSSWLIQEELLCESVIKKQIEKRHESDNKA